MKIDRDKYQEVLRYVEGLQKSRYEFVFFEKGYAANPLAKMFPVDIDYELSKQVEGIKKDDRFPGDQEFWFVPELFGALTEGLQDKSLLIEKDNLIDLEQMVTAYAERINLEQAVSLNRQDGVNIYAKEIHEILDELLARQADGDTLVAYTYDDREGKSFPINMYGLVSFPEGDDFAAAEYQYENSTDIDQIEFADISKVIAAIGIALQSDYTSFVKDGILNLNDTFFNTPIQDEKASLDIKMKNVMNQKNITGVKDQVFYTGFEKNLDPQIHENIAKGVKAFEVSYQPGYGPTAEATAHFSKSTQDNYFFNKWVLDVDKGTDKAFRQTFYNDNAWVKVKLADGGVDERWVNSTITVKEGWNLFEKRAVLKEFKKKPDEQGVHEVYKAWLKIDFSKPPLVAGNYDYLKFGEFDLGAKLDEVAITGRDIPEERKIMIDALERGNRIEVDVEGSKYFTQVNPRFQGLDYYYSDGKPLGYRAANALKIVQPDQNTKQSEGSNVSAGVSNGQVSTTETKPSETAQSADDRKKGQGRGTKNADGSRSTTTRKKQGKGI